MARLPTASEINRPIPAARTWVAGYTPQNSNELEIAGKVLGEVATNLQSQKDELDAAHVGSEFTVAYAKRLNAFNEDQDFETMPERYTKDMNATKDQLLANVSPRIRGKLSARLDSVIAGGLDNVLLKQNHKKIEYGKADSIRKFDEIKSLISSSNTLADFNNLYKPYDEDVKAKVNAGILSPIEGYELTKKLKNEAAQEWFNHQSLDKQLEIIGKSTTKARPVSSAPNLDSVVSTIMKNELPDDGMVKIHPDGDGQAIGGINSESFPAQFNEAKNILETKGQDATKEYLADFYQKEIIEKNGIDKLPADIQAIVADGVTNHWAGFQKELISAAKEGATPEQLIEMRRREYQRLATENPKKYAKNLAAWNNRLDSFSSVGIPETGTPADFIPVGKRAELYNKTLLAVEAENKLKIKDPAQYGEKYGLSMDEIVGFQPNPATASVVTKNNAAQIVQQIKDAASPDQIIILADQIKSKYGKYTYNAIRDLADAKMPDEYQAAINLALQDPVDNHERIRLLYEAGKSGYETINEIYKTTVFTKGYDSAGDPKALDDDLISLSYNILQAMDREGYSLEDQRRNFKITSSLAKTYRIKNPSISQDDAIDFALSYQNDKYDFAELNGTKYRVPRSSPEGTAYDVKEINERLASHYENIEFNVNSADEKIAKNIGANLKNIAIPFLNATQDGVRFRSPSGEVLLNKTGQIAELKFKDVIANPTPYEIKQERINASFAKRKPRF